VLLLDLSAVPDTDVTALHAAADLRRSLAERGAVLGAAGVLERPLAMLQRLGAVLEGRTFPEVESAVEAYTSRRVHEATPT
jgi:hypothetical protein